MTKPANNYSNMCLPKSVDNSYQLTLNGMRFQPADPPYSDRLVYAEDQNGELGYTEFTRQEVSLIPHTIIEVHSSFADDGNRRSTISGALAYAKTLSPSQLNIIQIFVHSDTYYETQPLALDTAHIHLKGTKDNSVQVLLVAPIASGLGFITIENVSTSLQYLQFNSQTNADYTLKLNSGSEFVDDCTFLGSTVAIIYVAPGASAFVLRSKILRTTSCSYGVFNDGGVIGLGEAFISNALLDFTGTAVYHKDSPRLIANPFQNQFFQAGFSAWNTGVLLDNSFAFLTLGEARNNLTGYNVTNGSVLSITSNNADNFAFDIVVDGSSSVFSNGLVINSDKISIADENTVSVGYLETNQDNLLSQKILGNLVVGSKSTRGVSYFGQGSFEVSGIVYLKDDGVSFTDVSEDLKPSAGLQTTLFDDLSASVFYLGDDQKFYSMEYLVATTLSGVLQFEYWDGSAWTRFDSMTTQSDIPYGSYEDASFSAAEEQDTRFSVELSGSSFNWTQSTVNGATKYWIRITIPSPPLTTSPVVDYLRLLYSSTKIDKNGVSLRYGMPGHTRPSCSTSTP